MKNALFGSAIGLILGAATVYSYAENDNARSVTATKVIKQELIHQYNGPLVDLEDNKKMLPKQQFDSIERLAHFKAALTSIKKQPVIEPVSKDTLGFNLK